MLRSIRVQNYRNLKDLNIKSLGQVNLFTGKNNTGKTTLLEAIAIFVEEANIGLLLDFLTDRGEYDRVVYRDEHEYNLEEINRQLLSKMFHRSFESNDFNDKITFTDEERFLRLNFAHYQEREMNDEIGTVIREILDPAVGDLNKDFKLGFEIISGDSHKRIIPLERRLYNYRNVSAKPSQETVQFIRTRNVDGQMNGQLWDKIALTDKETNVIEALRLVEPRVERIAFIESKNLRERATVIKLKDSAAIFPLKSMGDGINRILTIILALVNAENGYLLIDEFENGLHFSVQEKLWGIIFTIAQKLNVQVFVTTHSEDCIRGFEQILNKSGNINSGKLIRLDSVNDTIMEVAFNAEELKIATNNDIDLR